MNIGIYDHISCVLVAGKWLLSDCLVGRYMQQHIQLSCYYCISQVPDWMAAKHEIFLAPKMYSFFATAVI